MAVFELLPFSFVTQWETTQREKNVLVSVESRKKVENGKEKYTFSRFFA